MNKKACGHTESPQTENGVYNIAYAVRKNKHYGHRLPYDPRKCEFCGRPLTRHERDLHHTDPLCDVFSKQPEEEAA